MRTTLLTLTLALLPGCYFSFDSTGSDRDDTDWDEWEGWGDDDSDVDDDSDLDDDSDSDDDSDTSVDPSDAQASDFAFSPSELANDAMSAVELTCTASLCDDIDELSFYGDVEVHTVIKAADSWRIALTVPPGADPGSVHVLVDLSDGSSVFVEDALYILAEDEQPSCE